MSSVGNIPSVAMDCILHPDDNPSDFDHASSTLITALETEGLAYLQFGPRTSAQLQIVLDDAFSTARKFFARPLSEKVTAAPKALPTGVTRGYLSTTAEAGGDAPENKEAFSWSLDMHDASISNPFEHANIWPSARGTHEGIDNNMKACFDNLFNFLHSIMLKIACALQPAFPPSVQLKSQCRNGASISLLRAFHYHAQSEALPKATGSATHTDWGFATLVAQEEGSAALQALIKGEWQTIVGRQNTLILNGSDFLTLYSCGKLQSPRHRVILTNEERFSFVFFQYPSFDEPMPSLTSVPVDILNNLSLLRDQRFGAGGRLTATESQTSSVSSFGALIAAKWAHVARRGNGANGGDRH